MNEFMLLLKSPKFRAFSSVFFGIVVLYAVSQVYKNVVEAKIAQQNIKINKFRIIEYKQKYPDLVVDKGNNEKVKFV